MTLSHLFLAPAENYLVHIFLYTCNLFCSLAKVPNILQNQNNTLTHFIFAVVVVVVVVKQKFV